MKKTMGHGIQAVLRELTEENQKMKRNPPPPMALQELRKHFDLTRDLAPAVRVVEDGVLVSFRAETQFLLMTARGARLLAGQLTEKADELESKKEKAG